MKETSVKESINALTDLSFDVGNVHICYAENEDSIGDSFVQFNPQGCLRGAGRGSGTIHYELYYEKGTGEAKIGSSYQPSRFYCELHVEKSGIGKRYWDGCLKDQIDTCGLQRIDDWRSSSNQYAIRRKAHPVIDLEKFKDSAELRVVVEKELGELCGALEPILQEFETNERRKEDAQMRDDYYRGIIELLEKAGQVIFTGAPGTGKTYMAREIAKKMTGGDEGRIQIVQFHPGYDYSDFVVGLKPVLLDDEGNEIAASTGKKCSVSFDWRKGVFVKFAEQAQKSDDPYVLIIDEINRADLSRVFGELFSLIEPDYRGEDHAIKLPNGKDFYVPSKLYIIGTMNDIDRSVDSMDFALRRRFAWKEVTAEESEQIIDSKVEDAGLAETLKGAMREINQYLGGNKKVALDGREVALGLGPEYQLGGAIFANATKYGKEEALSKVWQNHVRVILSEYLRGNKDKNGILRVFAKEFGVSEY